MIGFFPTLYPDELLYSGCARYRSALGIDQRARAQRALFGNTRGLSVVELPGRLATLVARLPPEAPYTVGRLLSAHTVLPYYRPFKHPDQIARVVHALTTDDAAGSVRMLLLGGSRVGRPAFLHYCAACVEYDRRRHGVAYWHRVHQLPGVLACPVHGTPVCRSGVRRNDRTSETRYFTLEEVLASDAEPRDLTPREVASWPAEDARPPAAVLRRLARDTAWLLTADVDGPGVRNLPDRYHEALTRQRLTRGTFVRTPELCEAVVARYGETFLAALGCPVPPDGHENWVKNAVRGRGRRSTLHPLHHLLLAQVAGLSITDLLAPAAPAPRRGPAGTRAASTPASNRTRRPADGPADEPANEVANAPAGRHAIVPNTADARRRPKRHANRKLGVTTPAWDARLVSLVQDRDVTQVAAATALGVTSDTLKRHARRLGVWRVEWCLRKKHLPGTRQAERVAAHRKRARKVYERLREKHSDAGRQELLTLAPGEVKWLRRYDKAWLDARQPAPRRAEPASTDALWRARDAELTAEVGGAVHRLRESPRPRRVTVTAVLRSMGRVDLLPKLDRLPETRRAIEAALESPDAFAERKLDRAVAQCRAEGVVPRLWQLRALAGLGSDDWARLRERAEGLLAALAGTPAPVGPLGSG